MYDTTYQKAFKWRPRSANMKQIYTTSLAILFLLVVYLAYNYSSYKPEEGSLSDSSEYEAVQEDHEHFQRHNNPANGSLDDDSSKIVYNESAEVETRPKSPALRVRDLYTQGHSEPHAELCPYQGSDLRLFVFITSAPDHFKERQAIRRTWGHYKMRSDIEIAFMIGITDNTVTDSVISTEDKLYGDIVRATFHDSYDNLTLKTVSMLEWVGTYCADVDFVLKTDDDMFINMENLLKFIDAKKDESRVIYGRVLAKGKPYRSKKSKYYLSYEEFAPELFPKFATGPAYLMSGDCVGLLYGAALDEKFLKLEDIFTTAILGEMLGLRRIDSKMFLNMELKKDCRVKDMISVVGINKQLKLWSLMFDPTVTC